MSGRRRRAIAIVGLAAAAVAGVAFAYLRPVLLPEHVRTSASASPPTITVPGEQVAITFLTPRIGWAAATVEPLEHTLFVFATDDGARSWRQTATLTMSVSVAAPPHIFRFFDETHGVLGLGNDGSIFRTNDGGRSWSRVSLPEGAWPPVFADFNDLWAITYSGPSSAAKIYSTTDGGASWARLPDLPVNGAVVFDNPNDGWLAADRQRVYRTTDGGRTWHRLGDLPRAECTQAPHQCAAGGAGVNLTLLSDGGLLAEDYAYEPQVVFISLNGGLGWRQVPLPPGAIDWNQVSYQDSMHWWLVNDNRLLKTADAGASWTVVSSSLPFALSQPTILDSDHAWVTFGEGDSSAVGDVLLITSDGGLSWKRAVVPIPH